MVMMPMAFWASLEPWLKLMKAAAKICSTRKPSRTWCGRKRRQIQYSPITSEKAITKPSTGESTRLCTMLEKLLGPSQWMEPKPWPAIPAPTMPPIRACEELEGRPQYQVTRFQKIADKRAATIRGCVT
ncbi:hypothetical protein D3C86_1247180 [compost metagenome]